jgi:hypothetical protein
VSEPVCQLAGVPVIQLADLICVDACFTVVGMDMLKDANWQDTFTG